MKCGKNDSVWDDVVPGISGLTSAELDRKLEEAVVESEKADRLICCFLAALNDRGAYRDFGYSTICDYARERFGFQERKTRYLVSLGRKLEELPQLREALRSGKLGWCKATRVASVATREDETLWVDSALSLSVLELDRRIKDGTDRLASVVHFRLNEDQRVLWENALETARRVAGSEISPVQAFEYLIAEFLATWADGGAAAEDSEDAGEAELEALDATEPEEDAPSKAPVLPFAEPVFVELPPGNLHPETERKLEEARCEFDRAFKKRVLERDGWRCSYPGCTARRELHVHHVQFRSHAGPNTLWNCTTLCRFHHELLHHRRIGVRGRAPNELRWTPPTLMRDVIERLRNRRPHWPDELEVRTFPDFGDAEPVGCAVASAG